MVDRNWRYFLFLLASHHPEEKLDHTIQIRLHGKSIFLCSRCTGIAIGMFTIFGFSAFGLTLPKNFFLPLIAFLPLLAVVDWFTQSARLRKSNTSLRLSSGFLLGISEALGLLLLLNGFFLDFLIVVVTAASYALTIYLIALKTKCLDAYFKEMNMISLQERKSLAKA